jgi:exosortase
LIPRKAGQVGAIALLVASFALLYWRVLVSLVRAWATDDNYSHGYLILPLAAYLAWERRHRLAALPVRPSTGWGLTVIAGSQALLVVGLLGAELFLSRIAMIATALGGVLFVLGRDHLRVLKFPFAVLLLMVPLPSIIFNEVAVPLQLAASRVGVLPLSAAGIPVLREGSLIVLAHTTLEVAEACSGIRSLISLLTLGIVYGYFADPRGGIRAVIALCTIPVAVVANGLRVAGTGIAAHNYGAAAAEGFFHVFAGWIVFVLAFLMLLVIVRVLLCVIPPRREGGPLTLPAA